MQYYINAYTIAHHCIYYRETWTGRGTDRQGQEYEQGQMDRNMDEKDRDR